MSHNLPVPDDAPWLNLSPQEIQELRSKKYKLTEYGKEKLRKLMNEKERQELAYKTFEELTKDEKIQLALEELAAIVMGGQDGEEYYNSVKFIKDVLESF